MADFAIDTTEVGLTNIEQLTTPLPEPKSSFLPYSRIVSLGNIKRLGVGAPIASWMFAVLSIQQYNQLKSFCPGASADIFIQTKIDDDTYAVFSGIINWPNDPQDRWYGERKNFVVTFTALIEIPEGS